LVSMYGIGIFTDWSTLAYVAMVVPCITFIGMLFQHETPIWLIKKQRSTEAEKVMRYFRDTDDISHEFDSLVGAQQPDLDGDQSMRHNPIYRDKVALKVIFYVLVMTLSNQFCGVNVVVTFTDSIFQSAGVSIKAEVAGFLVGLVMFLFTIISTPIIGRFNRRPLLFISLSLCSISMICFGFYFYTRAGSASGWIPIACLVIFILSFSLGMGPLCFVLLGDFSLPRLAALAGTILGITNWGSAFLLTYIYSDMQKALGLAGTFWFYGICSAAGALFSLFVLPETKGKGFQEIEAALT